ncbi:hypothetical protein [Streptomyces dengpaensis]|uniref:hypothetical protein n=1 Tax=Streptomyces dengpaensis TaxID=2049881 RepID=UPI0019D11B85|nr:hypothetical protein [Streptomyces dengpaensis]
MLDRCHPASSPWPQDTPALARLADAETLLEELVYGDPLPTQERNARTWPAIETWLTDSETFVRQARVSAPHQRTALAVSAPPRPLPATHPVHRR